MKSIAVIGAKGFVGSAIYNKLLTNKSLITTGVTRQNYSYYKKKEFDIVINAAMPAARFWARQNPHKDFNETVKRTANIVNTWNYNKIIQISTISARSELDSVYGRHKAAAEKIVKFGQNQIVRLTSMYADTLTTGALIDILNKKKVFVDGKSRYAFASLDFVSNWISTHLDETGLIELGAKNSLSIEEIVKHLKLDIRLEGKVDMQEVRNPRPEFPDAREVLSFLKNKLKK